jgi:acetyl esterase
MSALTALDRTAFDSSSVAAETFSVTERLREEGAGAPPLSADVIAQLRRAAPGRGGPLRAEPSYEGAVERLIDGPGGAVRLRLLVPSEVRACYLHVHGGGWALGAPDRQDRTLLRFAASGRVAVVAVDYRLTPEHPHPAAVTDCVAALEWLSANAELELGASRVIVGGESAGAHLATLALLDLRDRGRLGAVAAANLAYGVYDVSMSPSARLWGDRRIVISTPDLTFFANQYAPPGRHRDPDVSPLYARLRGLPPALFTCGTLDPLLDDTLFMAVRWQEAGNASELALYPGAPHEFLNLSDRIPVEDEARDRMLAFIDRVLAG